MKLCVECLKDYAGVSCNNCSNYYHFPCAYKSQGIFLKNKTFNCQNCKIETKFFNIVNDFSV